MGIFEKKFQQREIILWGTDHIYHKFVRDERIDKLRPPDI